MLWDIVDFDLTATASTPAYVGRHLASGTEREVRGFSTSGILLHSLPSAG